MVNNLLINPDPILSFILYKLPFFILGTFVLLILLILIVIRDYKNSNKRSLNKKVIIEIFILLMLSLLLIILISPIIYSWQCCGVAPSMWFLS